MAFLEPTIVMTQARYLYAKDMTGTTQFVFQNRTENPVSHMNKDKTKTLSHFIFEFKNRSMGTVVLYWLSPRDAQNIMAASTNSIVEAYINGNFVNWRMADGDLAPIPNRVAVDNELAVGKNVAGYEQKHVEVVTSQILHGFMRSAIGNGKTPIEAYQIALDAYGLHALALESALLNRDGIMKKAKDSLLSLK